MTPSFFSAKRGPRGEVLVPVPYAASQWGGGDSRVRGMAVSGALARAAEGLATREATGARPARWTVDLFRPVSMEPCTVRCELVRRGRRLCSVDAFLDQGDRTVARGRGLFLVPRSSSGSPDGVVWTPADRPTPPPTDLRPWAREPRLYHSERVGWTASPAPHQNSDRKMLWHFAVDVVEHEESSPFQLTAMCADLASVVVNWGSNGMAHINADIELAVTRLPEAREIGLAALHRTDADGLAAGTAVLFDRTGSFGTAGIVALAGGQTVDPAARA